MDSAEYERKIASRFAAFDQDGNGYIDREDFSGAAAALLGEFSVTARSERGQALYSGAEAFWQGMAGIADVDGDQRVSRQEFVTGAVKRLRDNPERFAEIARPFLHAVIAVADADGSGLTPASVERVLRVLGVEPGVASEAARTLDADGDGRIDEEELLKALAAYYVTPEP
ncbi:EF-hand domain-containing protein [Streptomyces sp. HNM0663]|uniref:EF-hand domain-containing protein n=1 Tax=Streptomyces chengmaiensis TaxID=3040919 RepID=A0ABT6HUR0_9ACTN|nr:EF-hand domain-containing protein [Streptomyces chengmaiensis]MDH2392110.1 EF-hand domain-containing protein [Streptomyces chengmaiensis]